ncbi:MAG TPA: phospholipase D family protein [Casimicrobiaceae bacterium]
MGEERIFVANLRVPGGEGRKLVGPRTFVAAALTAFGLLLAGCATLPPGMDAPKSTSTALANPETTALGKSADALAKAHPGLSGFDLVVDGAASFAWHQEIAARAERTLDVQYFLFKQDETGKLLLESLLEAADRGVRVRLLLDDAEAFDKGSMIRPLAAHPNIEIRIFNPFVVRGELSVFRWAEFVVGSRRLNYRMHNKLFIGDNAIALTGGRNVGDSYFQASTVINLGDFDLGVAGPMVGALSQSFDVYWNDRFAIPVDALPLGKPSAADLEACRKALMAHKEQMTASSYMHSVAQRNRFAEFLSGKRPLVWAKATLAYDPPDKAQVERDGEPGRLMWKRVVTAVEGAQRELIIVSPYLVPGETEMALISRLRDRGVRVRILTNSLASTDMPIAHAGYIRYRVPLLEAGCDLYEVRPVPGEPEAHGLVRSGGSGQFGLHAKVFVIDRQRVFVGSMNFDQRSLAINTEIGLIIDSPQIADEIAGRFEAITQPANSYRLALEPAAAAGPAVEWMTMEGGKTVKFSSEPDVDAGKLALIDLLSLLPLDRLL